MGWPKGVPRSPETIAKLSGPRKSLEERYWAKVDVRSPDECWPWKRKAMKTGYGAIGVGPGRSAPAHRVGYELAHGPIPSGLVVDHECHNQDPDCPGGPCKHRACQNPAHLRLRTQGENVLAGKGFAPVNAAKTHCDKGHAFDEKNTYIRPSDGWRDCRACKAATQRRYLERKATKAA
jgi:hypothetical protein